MHYKAKYQNNSTVYFSVVLQCKHFSGICIWLQKDGYLQISPQIRKIPLSSSWTLQTRYKHHEHTGSHIGAAAGALPRILNTKRHTKHVKQKCLSILWIPAFICIIYLVGLSTAKHKIYYALEIGMTVD